MAPTLKRKGIAISNRRPAKRQKPAVKRDRLSTSRSEQQLPPAYRNGEWPLKRILRERKNKYLVDWADHPLTGLTFEPTWEPQENVGLAAIEEWEAERQKENNRPSDRPGPPQKNHSGVTTSDHRDNPLRSTDQASSQSIAQEEQNTPGVPRYRQSRNRIILSSPLSIEIPETQQEVSSTHRFKGLEVVRPVDLASQDYSTLAGSQVTSILATQDTGVSKGTTEGDSALGSSVTPDSPIQAEPDLSSIQESSSQALQSHPSNNPRSSHRSAARLSLNGRPVLAGVDSPLVGQESHSESQQRTEHIRNSLPPSPLFVTDDEDLLRPIADPNLSREDSAVEGEFEVLPLVSSSVNSNSQQAIHLGTAHSRLNSSVPSAQSEPAQSETRSRARIVHTDENEEHEGTRQLSSTTIESPHKSPARPTSRTCIHTLQSTPSPGFRSQLYSSDVLATPIESLSATTGVRTPHKSPVTVQRRSQTFAALSSPDSPLRPISSPIWTSQPVASSPHPALSPHDSVSSGASRLSSTKSTMASSQQESLPRVRRAPSAQSEMTPESSLREKLRQIRATSRANQQARVKSQGNAENSRSPSVAAPETRPLRRRSAERKAQPLMVMSTPTEDQPIPSMENIDGATSEMDLDRADAGPALSSSLPPSQLILDTPSGSSMVPVQDLDDEKAVPELEMPTMPLLQPSEFVVPLPIDGRIKHQYIAELKEYCDSIGDFLNSPRSPRLVDAIHDMIRRLNNTVVHTDLGLNGPATQIASTAEEVLWAEDASSKFAFLGRLIRLLRGAGHHIVLVARSGTTKDLLFSYLKGKHVTCRQYAETDTVEDSYEGDRDDSMRYTLVSSNKESLKNIPRSASLVIAFDDSFDATMLPKGSSTTRFVPVLLLLIVNSAEHVGRCIPQDISEPERLRRLVKAVVHVRDDLGEMPFHTDFRHAFNLDPGARLALVKKDLGAKISHAAGKTAEALNSKNFALNFSLRPISELDLSGLEDQPTSTEQSKEVSSSASRAGTPAGQKRLRDDPSSSAIQAKRQRLTPLRDITHISDSLKPSQSQTDELKTALKKAQQDLSEEQRARVKAEESTTYTHSRLQEITQSLAALQYRYETRTKQVHELRNETKRLDATLSTSTVRLSTLQSENVALKDQRLQLQTDLRDARDALTSSTNPDIAALESARASARSSGEDSARLQTTIAHLRRDFEFTRSQYQDASTKAAEYAAQIGDLESRNQELQARASDERRRLRDCNQREERRRDLSRIAELEAELRNMEALLRRVQEENKAVKAKGRGGVVTRAGSVQPGGGSGTGPGVGAASPRAAVAGGGGSRAGSPALAVVGVGSATSGLGSATVGAHAPLGGRASALRNER